MTYTTHGLMTPADMADMRDLYDLDAWKDEAPAEDDEDEYQDLLDSVPTSRSRESYPEH